MRREVYSAVASGDRDTRGNFGGNICGDGDDYDNSDILTETPAVLGVGDNGNGDDVGDGDGNSYSSTGNGGGNGGGGGGGDDDGNGGGGDDDSGEDGRMGRVALSGVVFGDGDVFGDLSDNDDGDDGSISLDFCARDSSAAAVDAAMGAATPVATPKRRRNRNKGLQRRDRLFNGR
jgi:hypothetical protein